jgi:hypothetical protein
MRVLPAVCSARWRSWVGSILDRAVEFCFNRGHDLIALRERIEPTNDGLSEERVRAIIAGVNARLVEYECVVPETSRPTVVLPFSGRH